MVEDNQHNVLRGKSRFAVIALAAIGLTIVFWLPLWQGGGLVGGDLYSYYFPQKTFLAERLQAGEIPLWNNRTGQGYPLIGESQTGVFYPFHLVLYRCLDVNTAYNTNHLLHYGLAFVFTVIYVRRFGMQLPSALFCGLIYTYGWFPVRSCLEWAIIGGAWLPAALWSVECLLQTRRMRFALVLTIVLALQMLAGHFQIAFITQLVLVVYVPSRLWWAADELRPDTGSKRRLCGIATIALLSGFTLAAVQLIPTWELKQLSQRKQAGENHNLAYGAIPVWYLSQSIMPWHWYSPLTDRDEELKRNPGVGGALSNQAEAHLYCGLVPLAFAIFGFLRIRSRRCWLWLILGFAGVIYAMGWLVPLTQHLPGFGFFQGPGRFGIVTSLAVAILAGFGLQEMASELKKLKLIGFVFLAVGVGSLVSSISLIDKFELATTTGQVSNPLTVGRSNLLETVSITVLICVGIGVAVTMVATWMLASGGVRTKSKRLTALAQHCFVTCLVLVTIADLWLVARLVTYTHLPQSPPIARLEESPVRILLSRASEPVRLFSPGANFPNVLGVSSTPVYLTFGPEEYVDEGLSYPKKVESESDKKNHLTRLSADQLDWLDRFGVTHILSFQRVVVPKNSIAIKLVPNENTSNGAVVDPVLNQAWGRGLDPLYLYELQPNRGRVFWEHAEIGNSARIRTYEANRVSIDVESAIGGRIVLTDLYFPGWTVEVDGVEAEPNRFEEIFRAVDVPAGKHTVVWKYAPGSVYWGALVSGLTLFVLAVIAYIRYRHPKLMPWLTIATPSQPSSSNGSRHSP